MSVPWSEYTCSSPEVGRFTVYFSRSSPRHRAGLRCIFSLGYGLVRLFIDRPDIGRSGAVPAGSIPAPHKLVEWLADDCRDAGERRDPGIIGVVAAFRLDYDVRPRSGSEVCNTSRIARVRSIQVSKPVKRPAPVIEIKGNHKRRDKQDANYHYGQGLHFFLQV